MTREAQKVIERRTLDVLLASLGLRPDQEPEPAEAGLHGVACRTTNRRRDHDVQLHRHRRWRAR